MKAPAQDRLTRRELLRWCGAAAAGLCLGGAASPASARFSPLARRQKQGLREAMYYQKLAGGMVHCELCPCSPAKEYCGFLRDGQTCVCNVRKNVGGTLYVTNYAMASVLSQDPVEKNPLHHFLPSARALTLATAGCNLDCACCQNWQLSQVGVEEANSFYLPPEQVVAKALENRCRIISYTYTEPIIFYEYMLDTAKAAHAAGLRNTVVTGGYICAEPLRELCRHVDAFSVSVKGFSEDFYLKMCRGRLETVLSTLKTIRQQQVWLEVVALIIPTLSDDMGQIRWFSRWVKANLGSEVPVHFTRFWPSYKLKNLPQTPIATLEQARKIAKEAGLRYAYVGNLPGHAGSNTYCASCGRTLLRRVGFQVIQNTLASGRCPSCGQALPGVWA